MKEHERAYIQFRLHRAEETLDDARLLLEEQRFHSAVNRLYYACFYVVEALLKTEGLSSSRHRGVRSLFVQHWIKTGRLPKRFSRTYHQIFDARMEADYSVPLLNPEKVKNMHRAATEFVAEVTKEVRKGLD